MAWTKSGTVSLTNGSAVVYGAGTAFVSGALTRAGDTFKAPDGRDYELLSVPSNTELRLVTPYLGTTASAQPYAIVHTGLLPAELAVGVSEMTAKNVGVMSQLYEWETSTELTVPMTNPATGVILQVKTLAQMIADIGAPTITGGSINGAPIGGTTPSTGKFTTLTLGTGLAVADGGTGRSTSTTAYGLIAAGTTATGAHQTLAAGLTTQMLVGGGAAALPVWTAATGSGAPVRATGATLVAPVLGVATGTSFNSLTGLSSATPLIDGVAAVGVATTAARGDHKHPTDTTRAPLDSPDFTGDVGIGGSLTITASALLGYGPGAGGSVTQATSKSTAVTLNKPCGQITMNSAAIAAGSYIQFVCDNTLVSANDICACQTNSPMNYSIKSATSAGRIYFILKNEFSTALSDPVIVSFEIFKGAAA